MRFKEALDRIEGLRFVADRMEILSELGRERLMNLDTTLIDLPKEHVSMIMAEALVRDKKFSRDLETVWQLLMQARNIRHTVTRLHEGKTLDDVELFEIKGLAVTGLRLAEIQAEWSKESDIKILSLETDSEAVINLKEIAAILDPEKTGSRSFHIYNAYSEELAHCRATMKGLGNDCTEEYERLMSRCLILEEEVRERLSVRLQKYAEILQTVMNEIGWLDLLLAKVKFALAYNLTLPQLAPGGSISYKGLRFLPAEISLKEEGKEFQPVDIAIEKGVTLITGANMGGKTVTLKSLALAQAMAQYGFNVAAREVVVAPVGSIEISWGDSQSALSGLSSFGAEILNIDRILDLTAVRPEETRLILIDEPGRTTNPVEGEAIVGAIVKMLSEANAYSLVTTHYSGIPGKGKRLRVKGLKEMDENGGVSVKNLSELMDYSLVDDISGTAPREALRIARLLGVTEGFAREIENNLSGKPN